MYGAKILRNIVSNMRITGTVNVVTELLVVPSGASGRAFFFAGYVPYGASMPRRPLPGVLGCGLWVRWFFVCLACV